MSNFSPCLSPLFSSSLHLKLLELLSLFPVIILSLAFIFQSSPIEHPFILQNYFCQGPDFLVAESNGHFQFSLSFFN